MQPEIGFSTLSKSTALKDIMFAAKHKFAWLEIDLDTNTNLKAETVRKIRQTAKDKGIRLIVHTPYFLPTSSLLTEVREAVFRYIEKSCILANKLGADRLTIHPVYREISSITFQSLASNLKVIASIGKKYEVSICLENFPKSETLLCYAAQDMIKMLKSVKGLNATLDVGHANTTNIKAHDYLRGIKDFIMDMHLHDNYGKHDEHNPLGKGNVDFQKLFSMCKKVGYKGPFTLEVLSYKAV